ncbi:hypothetical protein ACFWHX_38600, partial [Streptomyces hirsutus]
ARRAAPAAPGVAHIPRRRRPRAAARAALSASRPAGRTPAYLAPGPHSTRAERAPSTPAGSRRPPHGERHPRGNTPATRS